ncbi:MAG: hypothetical protein EOO42_14555 [Flavobacteriales bacterium]|nr:MAG: hypothetical protein EOO42_14555 [Flavobacteriales bacterium]
MQAYLLDENLNRVGTGESGELYIGGDRLARGYHNLPELTAKTFVANPFATNERLYKTGDICEFLPSGDLLFLGRIDDQVKIRGYRIELGEIEHQLNQFESITQAFVLANPTSIGEKKLVAYYQSESNLDPALLTKYLQKYLPEHMVPRIYVPVKEIPLTSNGKVDKKVLQQIKISRPNLANLYKKPQGIIEENIYALWSEYLEIEKIGVDDNFFELGGDSLLAQRIISLLKEQYPRLTITKLYQFPTINGLAQYLVKNTHRKNDANKIANTDGDIAVISMAGRFPGADTIDELWELLVQGKEAITFFDEATLDPSIPDSLKNDF